MGCNNLLTKIIMFCTLMPSGVFAMQNLSEDELSTVSGEGIGLVFEDFQFNAKDNLPLDDTDGYTFKITGIEDQNGNAVDVSLGQFYIAGTGTNYGADLEGKTVNLGRLNHPYKIDVLDGNTLGGGGWTDKAVLAIAAPELYTTNQLDGYNCAGVTDPAIGGKCTSRPADVGSGYKGERMDIGMSLYTVYDNSISNVKNTNLNFHAKSANFDGSYIRLWGDNIDENGNGTIEATEYQGLSMEARLNLHADEFFINSCQVDGTNCGDAMVMTGVKIRLALGDQKYFQPATFDVDSGGNFVFKIHKLPSPNDPRIPGTTHVIASDGLRAGSDTATWDWYNDYYTNGAKSMISIDNLTVGSESFGSSSIRGLQIQYLEVTSHDL